MSEQLVGVIIGGALAVIGGLIGQMYAARAQARQRQREAAAKACDELSEVLRHIRLAHYFDVELHQGEEHGPRTFLEQEAVDSELIDKISRLAARVTDRRLRRTITQFLRSWGPLENQPNYMELLDCLIERCGCVVRGEFRRSTLRPVRRAIAHVRVSKETT